MRAYAKKSPISPHQPTGAAEQPALNDSSLASCLKDISWCTEKTETRGAEGRFSVISIQLMRCPRTSFRDKRIQYVAGSIQPFQNLPLESAANAGHL